MLLFQPHQRTFTSTTFHSVLQDNVNFFTFLVIASLYKPRVTVCCRCEALGLISRCLFLEAREATENEILMQHSLEQVKILKATSECRDEEFLEELSSRYDAIYFHPVSRKLCGSERGRLVPKTLRKNYCIITSPTAFMTSCRGVVWLLVSQLY